LDGCWDEGRKKFFFEKKNQKTFAPGLQHGARWASCARIGTGEGAKVFWFFFSKKNSCLMPTLRDTWLTLKHFRRATRVRTRAELDAALARAPRYIVVEGTEALRAHAASLAYRGGEEAARLEEAAPAASGAPSYMVVPTVGRIRDGYRQRTRTKRSVRETGSRGRMQAGTGTVAAAFTALFAALLIEYLSWPEGDPELVRGPLHVATPPKRGVFVPLPTHAPATAPVPLGVQIVHVVTPVLALIAAVALGVLIWQAIGAGRRVRVSWRVDHRVQGRLVIARIRTRLA